MDFVCLVFSRRL